jgi:hypothetical protein
MLPKFANEYLLPVLKCKPRSMKYIYFIEHACADAYWIELWRLCNVPKI